MESRGKWIRWCEGRGWFGRWVREGVSESGLVELFDEWFDEIRWMDWNEFLRMKGGD